MASVDARKPHDPRDKTANSPQRKDVQKLGTCKRVRHVCLYDVQATLRPEVNTTQVLLPYGSVVHTYVVQLLVDLEPRRPTMERDRSGAEGDHRSSVCTYRTCTSKGAEAPGGRADADGPCQAETGRPEDGYPVATKLKTQNSKTQNSKFKGQLTQLDELR